MLSSVLSGEKTIKDIFINSHQWYCDNAITLYAGIDKTVVRIDRKNRAVYTQDGTIAHYDKLVIATGSEAIIAAIPGNTLQGVVNFRNIFDVNKMLTYSKSHKKAVVLGGGLLGLEAANGLVSRGMDVTVIHNNEVLLNRQLDGHAGKILQQELEKKGLKFKMGAKTERLLGDENGHLTTVRFEDNSELPCDLFIMAIGIKPNIVLAKKSDIHCEKGIVVNDNLQSNDPHIFAVGECIQHRGDTFGLVTPCLEQARVCANNLSNNEMAKYIKFFPTPTKLKVTGISLFSIGDFIEDDNSETIQFTDPALGIYKKLIIKANKLVGTVLYGDTTDSNWYQELLEKKESITDIRDLLIFGKAYV